MLNNQHEMSSFLKYLLCYTAMSLVFSNCRMNKGGLVVEEALQCSAPLDSIGEFQDSSIFIDGRNLRYSSSAFTDSIGQSCLSVWWPARPFELFVFSSFELHLLSRLDLKYSSIIEDSLRRPNFAKVNDDGSLLVRFEDRIRIVRSDSILYEYRLPGRASSEVLTYYAHALPGCDPYFNPSDTSLRLCIFAYDFERVSKGEYVYPYVESVYYFSSDRTEISPIKRSNLTASGSYGFATNYYRYENDSISLYSWESDPSFTVYNHRSTSLKIYSGKSRFDVRADDQLPKRDRKNTTAKLRQLASIGRYSRMSYNSSRKEYFRIFMGGVDQVRADGLYNTIADQPLYLQIFSDTFCLIDEIRLGTDEVSMSVLPLGNGYINFKVRVQNQPDQLFEYIYYE